MEYSQYILNNDIKILSNYPFKMCDVEDDFNEFLKKVINYDFGVWIDDKNKNLKFTQIKIYNNKRKLLNYEDVVLNFLVFFNEILREQIGVCVDKKIPKIVDNKLTYLIIQRKDYKDFDENYFIANKGEIIFPAISKEYNLELALIKLADLKRRSKKNLIKFHINNKKEK
ncbi:hypothetical protein [Caminibacter mediatlanticus]|uniref:Stationary phase survival protein SurE n=1 Tax=Caminibacter mediatlanticus TB-2 TaxID=391592 RepID=A0AAI9AIN1_9BACT|nr:hypothetical protein [Caminibacter mediatlanticus]EDM24202.1 stationary phase survival protein SurE [Caminibacter mediatlanticus TB-2]